MSGGAHSVAVRNVTLRFGGVTALNDVSFDLGAGTLGALIGPNGAGKTSLFNCLSGLYRPTSGSVEIAGTDVTRLSTHRIARLGIARTFQSPSLFKGLDVIENLMMGTYMESSGGILTSAFRAPGFAASEAGQRERAEEILDLLEIPQHRHASVEDLPYGLQKRVEFGRALAARPRLLLLDEPMAGMTLEEKEDMVAFIFEARERIGFTLLLVEHDMGVVMEIAEHIVVLNFGRKLSEGTPAQVRGDPSVVAAYLGEDADAVRQEAAANA